MPLGTIAPWLQLPDYLGAVHAGASIGLSQRQLAQEAELKRAELAQQATEAAGRLGLGYAELGGQQRKADAERELALATLALRGSRYSDLSNLADEKLDQGDRRLTSLDANRATVNALRSRGLDLSDDRLDSLNENRDTVNSLHARALNQGDTRITQARDLAGQRLAQQRENQDRIDARVRPAAKPGVMDIEIPRTVPGVFGDKTKFEKVKGVRIDDPLINEALGNVPGLGTNYVPRTSHPALPARSDLSQMPNDTPADESGMPSTGQPSPTAAETVRVKSSDGVFGYIPFANLEKAKKLGYSEAPLTEGQTDEQ